jgi:hypothetical protein
MVECCKGNPNSKYDKNITLLHNIGDKNVHLLILRCAFYASHHDFSPGAKEFLKTVSEKFEIHVVTKGIESYGREVC